MKYGLKKAMLIFSGIISGGHLFAQSVDTAQLKYGSAINAANYRTWSVGISAGISTPYTLVGYNGRQDFTSPDIQWGYGVNVKDQLTHGFALQADIFAGKLKADHAQQTFANGAYIYSGFDTKVNWSASLSGNFTIAHIYNKKHQGIIQPYLSLGVGVMSYTPTLHSYFSSPTYLPTGSGFFLPVGAGFKFNIARSVNLDFGYQVNFAGDDKIDGYTYGPTTDRFSYTHLGLEFVLGKRSKLQMSSISRLAETEMRDKAREHQLQLLLQEQGLELDREKAANMKLNNDLEVADNIIKRYSTDSDGDGVPDFFDKCPNTPAGTKVDGTGCPIPDVKPEVKAVLTIDDWRVVTNTMRSLEFYPGTSVISERSFPDLNKLVQLIINKKQSLKIEVHMAGAGKPDDELNLSKERAGTIKTYLVNRGADAGAIQTFGYGSIKPLASNKTAKGRKINERVILSLF